LVVVLSVGRRLLNLVGSVEWNMELDLGF
jgi:hypothetical protein